MVNAEFNWWLLIVGLVVGAGLTWLVLADLRRGEDEVDAAEIPPEAAWIADRLAAAARPLSVEAVEAVLRAHRDYLRLGPADLDAILGGRQADPPHPSAGSAPKADGALDWGHPSPTPGPDSGPASDGRATERGSESHAPLDG